MNCPAQLVLTAAAIAVSLQYDGGDRDCGLRPQLSITADCLQQSLSCFVQISASSHAGSNGSRAPPRFEVTPAETPQPYDL